MRKRAYQVVATITNQSTEKSSLDVWWRIIVSGAIAGLLFYGLLVIINLFVIEPLACRNTFNAAVCQNSQSIAGNVASIIVAIIGTVVLVRQRFYRPLIITLGTAASLWSLGALIVGLGWLESLGWSALLYGLAYFAFEYVTRIEKTWLAVVGAVLIPLVIGIILAV